jgi:hypothetical protein
METLGEKLGYKDSFSFGNFNFHISEPDYFTQCVMEDGDIHMASTSFNPEDHLSLRSSDLFAKQVDGLKTITGIIEFNVPTILLHGQQTDSTLLKELILFFAKIPDIDLSSRVPISNNKFTLQAPNGGITSIHTFVEDLTMATITIRTFFDSDAQPHEIYHDSIFTSELWGRIHNFIATAERSSNANRKTTDIYIGGTPQTQVSDTQIAIQSELSHLQHEYGDIALPKWDSDINPAALKEYEDVHQLTSDELSVLAQEVVREKRVNFKSTHTMRPIKHRDITHFIALALERRRQLHDENSHRD